MNEGMEQIDTYIKAVAYTLAGIRRGQLEAVATSLWETFQRDGTIFICGNGGSAATASHFANDLSKGTINWGRRRARALALTDNVPLLTAWSNDVAYESIFAEQLAGHYRPGDLLFAISGSGNSPNVLSAVDWATSRGAPTVGLSGFNGGTLATLVTHSLVVANYAMPQVEDAHSVVCHALAVWLRTQIGGIQP